MFKSSAESFIKGIKFDSRLVWYQIVSLIFRKVGSRWKWRI